MGLTDEIETTTSLLQLYLLVGIPAVAVFMQILAWCLTATKLVEPPFSLKLNAWVRFGNMGASVATLASLSILLGWEANSLATLLVLIGLVAFGAFAALKLYRDTRDRTSSSGNRGS